MLLIGTKLQNASKKQSNNFIIIYNMQNPIVSILFTMLMGFSFLKTQASVSYVVGQEYLIAVTDSITGESDAVHLQFQFSETNSFALPVQIVKDSTRKEKIISALLALPFPFGFMGAHRIMLGCKPWVPIVYVATFGGCFGLLPLIDFFVITFSKNIEQYENNPHIFMWVK